MNKCGIPSNLCPFTYIQDCHYPPAYFNRSLLLRLSHYCLAIDTCFYCDITYSLHLVMGDSCTPFHDGKSTTKVIFPMNQKPSRSPRFNLKISPLLRSRFEEPFDAYLSYLLDLSAALTTFDPLYIDSRQAKSTTGQNRWTIWVSKEIRDKFNVRKATLAPSKTHGQFVELLLLMKDTLSANGIQTHFKSVRQQAANQWSMLLPRQKRKETRSPHRPTLSLDISHSNYFPQPIIEGNPSPEVYSTRYDDSPQFHEGSYSSGGHHPPASRPLSISRNSPHSLPNTQNAPFPSPDILHATSGLEAMPQNWEPLESLFNHELPEEYSSFHNPNSFNRPDMHSPQMHSPQLIAAQMQSQSPQMQMHGPSPQMHSPHIQSPQMQVLSSHLQGFSRNMPSGMSFSRSQMQAGSNRFGNVDSSSFQQLHPQSYINHTMAHSPLAIHNFSPTNEMTGSHKPMNSFQSDMAHSMPFYQPQEHTEDFQRPEYNFQKEQVHDQPNYYRPQPYYQDENSWSPHSALTDAIMDGPENALGKGF